MVRKEFYTIEDSDTIFNINSKGWYLKGWSRAGLKTGFLFYPFKILFDCGIYTSQKPNIIFLTHQHTDHTQAISHICSRHKPITTTIYLPETSIKFITKYERAISELSNPETEKLTDEQILNLQNIKLIPANPSDIFDIIVSEQKIRVEVLKAYHDVESNGYGFSLWSKKIKEEYRYLIEDFTQEEKNILSKDEIKKIKFQKIEKIKELKKNQIDIYDRVISHEFAFFCDSTIQNLSTETEWIKYPTIVCECTGLDVSKLHSSRDYDKNHTSLMSLKPIMLKHKDKKWFLIHISMGCEKETIQQIESELIAEELDVKICI